MPEASSKHCTLQRQLAEAGNLQKIAPSWAETLDSAFPQPGLTRNADQSPNHHGCY